MRIVSYIHERPLLFIGMILGIAIFLIIFFRGESVRTRVGTLEGHTPCLNLNKYECALKLFRALPEEERKQLKINGKVLRRLERKARNQRQILRGETERPPSSSSQRAGGVSPGPNSTGRPSPSTRGKGPGSRPGNTVVIIKPGHTPGPVPTITVVPSNTPTPSKTPIVHIPAIGPIPTIDIPCIDIKPLINC